MKRHAHMIDLLRPGLTFTQALEFLGRKHELTQEDLKTIRDNALGVSRAADIVMSQRRREQ
jgi:hypothetical protein